MRHRGSKIDSGLSQHSTQAVHKPVDNEPSLTVLADVYREQEALTALVNNRVDRDIRNLCACHLPSEGADPEILAKALMQVVRFDGSVPFETRSVVVVGPKGAGKTASIAKLAARLRLALDVRVGIVDAVVQSDEVDQCLKHFAEMNSFPFESIDTSLPVYDQVPNALAKLEQCDLILVDTPGTASGHDAGFEKLDILLSNCAGFETLLTLEAPKSQTEMQDCISTYARLGCSRAIVTKIDQSGFLGPIVNVLHAAELPIGFFATGARIPEDVEPASARRLAWMLLRRMH